MFNLSFPLILSTFGIIFIAELPDKTALAALVLATKYRARDVLLGTWLAFFVQTVVAILFGSILTFFPPKPIHIFAGLMFLLFAFLAGTRKHTEPVEKEKTIAKRMPKRPIWLASFLVIFLAEWGDLSQLATAALVAKNHHPLSIGIGSVLGLWAVTLVAIYSGSKASRFLTQKRLNLISTILFTAIGLYILVSALL